jgi:predicted  nucleic acid-binding Zn-ribbon protein
MEASERPQLPLDGDQDGTVRALEDRLVIERLEVIDAGAARVVRDQKREGHEPAETVTRAIEIGARVIESEGTAANVDFVNSQFERHMGSLGQELAKSLETGSEELSEQIAASFGADRSGSVQQQIREMLIKANEHQRTEMVRLFNAEGGANPLSDFKASVTAKVAESAERSERQAEALREQVANLQTEIARLTERREGDEALAEAEEAGTRKGRSFEERVNLAIERLADSRGDCAHAVGDVQGKAGSKKGDAVVEIGGGEGSALGRIVVEIKDSQLSRPQALSEMNGALEARDADYALLVVAGEDAIPTGGVEEMHEYQGNKLIVSVDPEEPDGKALELAYRYASLRVRAGREAAAGVDAAAVRTAASEARDAIASFKTVKSALTSATKQVERAQTGVEDIEQSVVDRLDRIEAAIEDAEELAD